MIVTTKDNKKYKGLVSAIAAMPKHDMHNGYYVEVFYDTELDKVYHRTQISLGFNSWTVFDDKAVIKIGNYTAKTTKKALIADIEAAIRCEAYYG